MSVSGSSSGRPPREGHPVRAIRSPQCVGACRSVCAHTSIVSLCAWQVHHFYPKLVELHNYSAANAFAQKMYNWYVIHTYTYV